MSKYEENPKYISFQTFSVMVQKALLKILVHRKWFFAQEYAVITNSDIVEIWINEQDSIVLTPVRGVDPTAGCAIVTLLFSGGHGVHPLTYFVDQLDRDNTKLCIEYLTEKLLTKCHTLKEQHRQHKPSKQY